MRGMDNVSSTFMNVLSRYHKGVQTQGGKLLLAEVSDGVLEQLERTGMLEKLGEANIFPETPRVYYATRQAIRTGQSWLDAPVAG
jgi:STAS domain